MHPERAASLGIPTSTDLTVAGRRKDVNRYNDVNSSGADTYR